MESNVRTLDRNLGLFFSVGEKKLPRAEKERPRLRSRYEITMLTVNVTLVYGILIRNVGTHPISRTHACVP